MPPADHEPREPEPTDAPEASRRTAPTGARADRAIPWFVSLALHLGLVAVAATVVWRVRAVDDGARPLVVRFDEPALAPLIAESPPDAPADASPSVQELLESQPEPVPAEPPALAPPPSVEPPAPDRAEATPEPAPKLDVAFSGLGASDARDIVYVVDASGSMVTSLPDVLAELRRSIEQLHPAQRFQVLLFRTPPDARPDHPGYEWMSIPPGLRKPVLIDATSRNTRAVLEWAARTQPAMISDPLPALEAALKLSPDAVFVLSGGETDPSLIGASVDQILSRVDRLNPVRRHTGDRRVVIKTIQVLRDDPQGLLRRIGETHGGENGYKFISADELSRRNPETNGKAG